MQQITWQDVLDALPTLVPVEGGFTHALRGLVTLKNGQKVFVKRAVDDKTREWIKMEIKAYHWLNAQKYRYAPAVLAEGHDGLALADLSSYDWSDRWDETKIDAILLALDELVKLSSNAGGVFVESTFGDNPWLGLPFTPEAYGNLVSPETAAEVGSLLAQSPLRANYTECASQQPWCGNDVVHYDVRADNFAYDPKDATGLLVDWNWAGLGNKKFDQTALLVNVQLSGFDVLEQYKSRLDKNSLMWLTGFWLHSAIQEQSTPQQKRLRPRQVTNALVAHSLAQRV